MHSLAPRSQIPAIVATALSFDRYGRRTTMLVLLTVASLACAALALLAAGLHAPHGARQAVSTLGMAAISSAFAGTHHAHATHARRAHRHPTPKHVLPPDDVALMTWR
jgi:MFS family permease